MNPGQNPVSTNTNKSGSIFLSAVQVKTKQSRGKKNMLSTSESFLLAASNPESVVTEITIRSCGLLFLRRVGKCIELWVANHHKTGFLDAKRFQIIFAVWVLHTQHSKSIEVFRKKRAKYLVLSHRTRRNPAVE